MKGTFFLKPLEWNLETKGESWKQGQTVQGLLRVKNHGAETITLNNAGVALAHGEVKKIHSRMEGALKIESSSALQELTLSPGGEISHPFAFSIGPNSSVTDKKSSYYLSFGPDFLGSPLQLKVEPKDLYLKIIGLLDTFYRFKLNDIKSGKKGVEFKLAAPTSKEMANVESLSLMFKMEDKILNLMFEFTVKKLDTSSITTKMTKESFSIEKNLTEKEYSLGQEMINQDHLLKMLETVMAEVKLKAVF